MSVRGGRRRAEAPRRQLTASATSCHCFWRRLPRLSSM
uniref:Uncharacterized protein n=1 Tax=Arundo donax TaxID=35708 RepID=A0A0A9HK84_ARUDO